MYSLKVPLRVLVESTCWVVRSGRVSFYFPKRKRVNTLALVSISSVSNSRERTVGCSSNCVHAEIGSNFTLSIFRSWWPFFLLDWTHFRHVVFSSQLKSKVGNILVNTETLRNTLNINGTPIPSRSHTHPSHTQNSRLLSSSLSLDVPVVRATQCIRDVQINPSTVLTFSLLLHWHPHICIPFNSRFIYCS